MSYISQNLRLHQQVEALYDAPWHWRDHSAWRVIAELMRRHPGQLEVMECAYSGGLGGTTVWYLRLKNRNQPWPDSESKLIARINAIGHINIEVQSRTDERELSRALPENVDPRFNTLDAMFSTHLDQVIRDLEEQLNLAVVSKAPPTAKETIGARLIASAVGLFAHSKMPLRVEGALFDGAYPHEESIESFRGLRQLSVGITPSTQWDSPKIPDDSLRKMSPIFFLHDEPEPSASHRPPSGEPIIAVNLFTGTAYLAQRELDLMQEYSRCNRDIELLAFELVRAARKERREQ